MLCTLMLRPSNLQTVAWEVACPNSRPSARPTCTYSTVQYSIVQPPHLGLGAAQPGAPLLELPGEAVQLRYRPWLCCQQGGELGWINLSLIWAFFLNSFQILSTINGSKCKECLLDHLFLTIVQVWRQGWRGEGGEGDQGGQGGQGPGARARREGTVFMVK